MAPIAFLCRCAVKHHTNKHTNLVGILDEIGLVELEEYGSDYCVDVTFGQCGRSLESPDHNSLSLEQSVFILISSSMLNQKVKVKESKSNVNALDKNSTE